nr:uncharacterized protein LOC111416339 isoform X1 [Onthophagus taurus]
MVTQRDNLRNQKLSYQLDEARNENKLLLNALQLNKDNNKDPSKSRTQMDFTSYSTVSLVHLQYKYEELSSSHEGLLKVLDSKVKECQKCYRENEELRDEIQNLKIQIAENIRTIKTLCDKYMKLKGRKDLKISSLRYERDTLKMVHSRLVNLLNQKY